MLVMIINHVTLQVRPRYRCGAVNCCGQLRNGSCARDVPCDCQDIGDIVLHPTVSGALHALCIYLSSLNGILMYFPNQFFICH